MKIVTIGKKVNLEFLAGFFYTEFTFPTGAKKTILFFIIVSYNYTGCIKMNTWFLLHSTCHGIDFQETLIPY